MFKPIEQTNMKSLLNEYGTSSTTCLLCDIINSPVLLLQNNHQLLRNSEIMNMIVL